MRGHDYFPLYFDRLRKSKWWRRASDTARARNVMMWGEAYKAVPAGSLPDDDDELAEAAGYGLDVDAFLSVKAEVMAPWVLCSDGRWYHPTLCEVVLEAWEKASDRRKKDAERKRAQREKSHPTRAATADFTPETEDVPRDIDETGADSDAESGVSALIEEKKGEERKEEEANASLSADADDPPPSKYPEHFEIVWKAYPHVQGRSSKKKAFGYWRRLPFDVRAQLAAAVARYAREGREPNNECGAPAMDRWLRDERFSDWISGDFAAPQPGAFASLRAPSQEWLASRLALAQES